MAIPKDFRDAHVAFILNDMVKRTALFTPSGSFVDPLTGRIAKIPVNIRSNSYGPWPSPQASHNHSAQGAGTGAGAIGPAAAGPTGSPSGSAGASAGTGGITPADIGGAMRTIAALYDDARRTLDPAWADYARILMEMEERRRRDEQDLLAAQFSTNNLLVKGHDRYSLGYAHIAPQWNAVFGFSDDVAPSPTPKIEILPPQIGEITAWRVWRLIPEAPKSAGVPVYVGARKRRLIGRLKVDAPARMPILKLNPVAKIPHGVWDRDVAPIQIIEAVTCRLERDANGEVSGVIAPRASALDRVKGFTPIPPHAGCIQSLSTDHVWLPGEVMQGELDAEPRWGGTRTGVHACRTLEEAVRHAYQMAPDKTETLVVGSVAIWGTAIEHERGWRAENARVLGFDEVVMTRQCWQWSSNDTLAAGSCELKPDPAILPALRKRYGFAT